MEFIRWNAEKNSDNLLKKGDRKNDQKYYKFATHTKNRFLNQTAAKEDKSNRNFFNFN